MHVLGGTGEATTESVQPLSWGSPLLTVQKPSIIERGAFRPVREKDSIMKDRIAVSPQIHFGKPCVAGTRIPVQSVLELVREGLTFAEIIRDYYPDLEM